ncbi:MAG TPA: non-homologous end-joining DNA ligase, partial [Flavisolibacter sp.]
MSLSLYNKKRRFDETPEPEGAVKSSKKALRFVIQKHDASSLHYDFRLELEGVLKSWAVPKGPSLNPADKRLAMHVEDHPYDYRNFEGIIPEGNYGGGTVIVWDEGTYRIAGSDDLSHAESEKALVKAYRSGNLKITLAGKKIKGTFSLRKLRKEGEEKAWLLIKSKDEFAGTEDITKMDQSVKSGKTIAQVAEENGTVPNHPEGGSKPTRGAVTLLAKGPKADPSKQKTPAISKKKPDVKNLLDHLGPGARKSAIPRNVKPMLATLTDGSFDDKNWLFEIKWDGYRAVAYVENDTVELISRNNKSYLEKYAPVAEALRALNLNAVLDGEIVAVDDKGLANFQQLQNWQNTPVQLQFFIFDILWLEGYDVTALPLIKRKELLRSLLPTDHEVIRYSDHVVEKGKDFFEVALAKGLEGVMAKKIDSIYEINARTEAWLKVKVNLRQEVVIVGYTKPRNTRTFFGALMLGVYDQGELIYIGHTGSGFDKKRLEAIYNRLQPLVV